LSYRPTPVGWRERGNLDDSSRAVTSRRREILSPTSHDSDRVLPRSPS